MSKADTTFHTVACGETRLRVADHGAGDAVVLLPSLGRGPADFGDLAGRLVAAGYRTLLPAPRGIEQSTGPLDGLTLHDLAADVAAVLDACDAAPAYVVGHAFGNRVARMLATDRPDMVRAVVLLACGGKHPIRPEITAALMQCFQPDLPEPERLAAIATAFFAAGNDARVWRDGWWPAAAGAQAAATQATDSATWWAGGTAPILVIQALEDAIAPPQHAGRELAADLGGRVTLVELAHAGHALLPEQPAAIAQTIVEFLGLH